MAEQKFWYVVRFNTREVDKLEEPEGILRTDYCLVQGTSYENVAFQIKNLCNPFTETDKNGKTLTLKKCYKIYGTEFERKSDAMDYLIDLKSKNKSS